jgi:hypothetical protein
MACNFAGVGRGVRLAVDIAPHVQMANVARHDAGREVQDLAAPGHERPLLAGRLRLRVDRDVIFAVRA